MDLCKRRWGQHAFAVAALAVMSGLTACAQTEIIQTAKNQAVVSTSAGPVCGTAGALRVANQMAAVATLRQGYERFSLSGVGTDSNVQVHQFPGSTYTPPTTVVTGRNSAQMQVFMMNTGDSGYQNALDAKRVLGPNWQKKVADGITACR